VSKKKESAFEQMITHLFSSSKSPNDSPGLFPSPWQALSIFNVITKSALPEFTDAAADNLFNRLFNSLATLYFVDEL
jgi:hypothetical protein